MWLWRLYERATRADAAISLGSWVWLAFTTATGLTGGAIMAWLWSQVGWFWNAAGWAGVATVGLLTWFLIGVGINLYAAHTERKSPNRLPHLASTKAPAPPQIEPAEDDLERDLDVFRFARGMYSTKLRERGLDKDFDGIGSPLSWYRKPWLTIWGGWGQPIVISQFGISAINIGDQEVKLDALYIVSGLTGARRDMQVFTGDRMANPTDLNPIPSHALVQAAVGLGRLSEEQFLTEWGTIHLVAEYEGKKERVTYDHAIFREDIDRHRLKPPGPRVTHRSEG